MTTRSELALLVEAEARLDRELATTRASAEAARAAAHARAELAERRLEVQIAGERERIARTLAAECAQRERAIETAAHAKLARYATIDGEALRAIAGTLARRLVEEAT